MWVCYVILESKLCKTIQKAYRRWTQRITPSISSTLPYTHLFHPVPTYKSHAFLVYPSSVAFCTTLQNMPFFNSLIGKNFKVWQYILLVRLWASRHPHTLLVGIYIGANLVEKNCTTSSKKYLYLFWPSNPTSRNQPWVPKVRQHKDIYCSIVYDFEILEIT